jgi:hypothetical protein
MALPVALRPSNQRADSSTQLQGEVLTVRWANLDPNPTAVEQRKRGYDDAFQQVSSPLVVGWSAWFSHCVLQDDWLGAQVPLAPCHPSLLTCSCALVLLPPLDRHLWHQAVLESWESLPDDVRAARVAQLQLAAAMQRGTIISQ